MRDIVPVFSPPHMHAAVFLRLPIVSVQDYQSCCPSSRETIGSSCFHPRACRYVYEAALPQWRTRLVSCFFHPRFSGLVVPENVNDYTMSRIDG